MPTTDAHAQQPFVATMSLRDWFAGQALTGLVAAQATTGALPLHVARECYELADAMMEVRAEAVMGEGGGA